CLEGDRGSRVCLSDQGVTPGGRAEAPDRSRHAFGVAHGGCGFGFAAAGLDRPGDGYAAQRFSIRGYGPDHQRLGQTFGDDPALVVTPDLDDPVDGWRGSRLLGD